MHLLDDLYGVFLDERLVGEDLLLLVEAGEVRGGHDVGDGAEAVEEHGDELDEDDGEEEEYQYDTYRLEVQVFFRDDDLRRETTQRVGLLYSREVADYIIYCPLFTLFS